MTTELERLALLLTIKEFCDSETPQTARGFTYTEPLELSPLLPDFLKEHLELLGAGFISVHGTNYDRITKRHEYFIYVERFGIEHI